MCQEFISDKRVRFHEFSFSKKSSCRDTPSVTKTNGSLVEIRLHLNKRNARRFQRSGRFSLHVLQDKARDQAEGGKDALLNKASSA